MKKKDPNAICVPFEELSAGERQENGLKIAEALSATGLRSIRYAREIPGMKIGCVRKVLNKLTFVMIEQ